jgi:hypothetical protein
MSTFMSQFGVNFHQFMGGIKYVNFHHFWGSKIWSIWSKCHKMGCTTDLHGVNFEITAYFSTDTHLKIWCVSNRFGGKFGRYLVIFTIHHCLNSRVIFCDSILYTRSLDVNYGV